MCKGGQHGAELCVCVCVRASVCMRGKELKLLKHSRYYEQAECVSHVYRMSAWECVRPSAVTDVIYTVTTWGRSQDDRGERESKA